MVGTGYCTFISSGISLSKEFKISGVRHAFIDDSNALRINRADSSLKSIDNSKFRPYVTILFSLITARRLNNNLIYLNKD